MEYVSHGIGDGVCDGVHHRVCHRVRMSQRGIKLLMVWGDVKCVDRVRDVGLCHGDGL